MDVQTSCVQFITGLKAAEHPYLAGSTMSRNHLNKSKENKSTENKRKKNKSKKKENDIIKQLNKIDGNEAESLLFNLQTLIASNRLSKKEKSQALMKVNNYIYGLNIGRCLLDGNIYSFKTIDSDFNSHTKWLGIFL